MNDAASRILLWFCRQPDPVQSAVMSAVDRGMEHAYAAMLRRLADEVEARGPALTTEATRGGSLGSNLPAEVAGRLPEPTDALTPREQRARDATRRRAASKERTGEDKKMGGNE